MKASDIKLTNQAVIKYCRREHKFQQMVYSRKINEKKMSVFQANQNHLIIKELGDIAKVLEQKGYDWSELKTILDTLLSQKGKRRVQGSLFKPSNFQK